MLEEGKEAMSFEVLEAKVTEVFPKEAQIKPRHRGSLKQPQKRKRGLK